MIAVRVRKFSGTQVASLLAIMVAGIVAVFFEPMPPLLEFLHSERWTRLIEWFGVSVAGLALLSWTGVTDMEFEISSSGGVRVRRVQANRGAIGELRTELHEMEKDNLRLRRLTRELRDELLLQAASGRLLEGPAPEEDDDVS